MWSLDGSGLQPAASEGAARRAGWVACKIVLDRVTAYGKVFVVREGQLLPKREVQAQWGSTLFSAAGVRRCGGG